MNFPKRILVCGDRNWTDHETMWEELSQYPAGTTIIHGDARGADRMAGEIARKLRMHVLAVPADWDKHGKAAGPIRNRDMFKRGQPDLVLAFHNDIHKSKGTNDMVFKVAGPAGTPVKIIAGREEPDEVKYRWKNVR